MQLPTPAEFQDYATSYFENNEMKDVQTCRDVLYKLESDLKTLAISSLDFGTYQQPILEEIMELVKKAQRNEVCAPLSPIFSILSAFSENPVRAMAQIKYLPDNIYRIVAKRLENAKDFSVAVPDALAYLVHRYAESLDTFSENVGICYGPGVTKYSYLLNMSFSEAYNDIVNTQDNDEVLKKLCVWYNKLVEWMDPFTVDEDKGVQKAVYYPASHKLYLRLGSSEDHYSEISLGKVYYFDNDIDVNENIASEGEGCRVVDNGVKCTFTPTPKSLTDFLVLLAQSISMDYRIISDYYPSLFPFYVDTTEKAVSQYEQNAEKRFYYVTAKKLAHKTFAAILDELNKFSLTETPVYFPSFVEIDPISLLDAIQTDENPFLIKDLAIETGSAMVLADHKFRRQLIEYLRENYENIMDDLKGEEKQINEQISAILRTENKKKLEV